MLGGPGPAVPSRGCGLHSCTWSSAEGGLPSASGHNRALFDQRCSQTQSPPSPSCGNLWVPAFSRTQECYSVLGPPSTRPLVLSTDGCVLLAPGPDFESPVRLPPVPPALRARALCWRLVPTGLRHVPGASNMKLWQRRREEGRSL